ncbi:FAD-dependent oxidoreductase [bacterium]|jgi:predicted NAD/FAD-binding protein|nr:FAD-dependent oxidoreductase [bacterium]
MKSIAIVGSGIAGLSAAWLLSQRYDVTVFEKQDRIGGHSNTVKVVAPEGQTPVDTGFIVYNEVNYPNLVALFDYLDVETEPSDMSFAVSYDDGDLEYGSRDVNAVFGQRRNILSPRFWKMLRDIRRFYADAPQILKASERFRDVSLGQYLSTNGYGEAFIEDFILPMGSAIWSTRADEMQSHPVETFVRFFTSHGLMQFNNRIPWRTVKGGSRNYVQPLSKNLAKNIKIGIGVQSIIRHDNGVTIIDYTGQERNFDALVVGAHANEALSMLRDADAMERRLLGAFRYTDNKAVLHRDTRLMPKRRQVWSSWNYMGAAETGASVTYWMNSLQSLKTNFPLFVTVNPRRAPDPSTVFREFDYAHPFYDLAALNAQESLWQLQGRRHTWFCGSYFGYGFHEDALQSGLAAAEDIGEVRRPWTVANESGRIHLPPLTQQAAQ